MAYYDMPDPDQLPDTTYKASGVHQNRDSSSKMKLEAMDREGITESARQATADSAEQAAGNVEVESAIAPDEPVIARKKVDTGQEVRAEGHKSAHKFTESVEAPGWQLPTMGGGGGGGMDMGSMMGGGGEGGGDSGGMSMGGGGDSGGGGGMAAMGGQIGDSISAMDDEMDEADDLLLADDTDVEAHHRLGERLQGR